MQVQNDMFVDFLIHDHVSFGMKFPVFFIVHLKMKFVCRILALMLSCEVSFWPSFVG